LNISNESTYHADNGQLLSGWQKFLDGDSEAFGQLVALYYAPLFQYGMKIHPDKDFVEDCIQEMATTLWTKRSNLSREVHVKSYFFKSLRHKMLRELQNHKTQQKRLGLWIQDYQPPFNAELSVESFIIDDDGERERKQQLHNCLQQLSHRQQEIIYLRYFQNLEHEQVAAIMKLTKEAAYNLLSMALKRLRNQWELLSGAVSGCIILLQGNYF